MQAIASTTGAVPDGGPLTVRDSTPADVPAITAIYAHAVTHGCASFETEPPDAAEMARRRDAVLALGLPHLVALRGGDVVGYAYASTYRPRPGYRYTVENSIYVAPAAQRAGVGRALLPVLIARCTAAGKRQMIAVIGDSANEASIALHRAFGFADAGVLRSVGFKFGRWLDSVLMQRALGDGDATVPPH